MSVAQLDELGARVYGDPRDAPRRMNNLLYIIGEPGVGKSTLLEYITRDLAFASREYPFPHRLYSCGVTEVGKRRPMFGGTDALSMAVQPAVLAYLRHDRPSLVIAEGDRLATASFFAEARALDYQLDIVLLWGPEVAAARRKARGTAQDEKWVAGRRRKVQNLAEQGYASWVIGADDTTENIAEAIPSPVIDRINIWRSVNVLGD